MKRKTFINRLTLGSGAVMLIPATPLLQGCEYEPQVRSTLTEADTPLLNEVAETFLPTTEEVAGAKSAKVGEYILLMYNDCMPYKEKMVLLEGINELDSRSAATFSSSFVAADSAQKLQLLETIQTEAITHNLKQKESDKPTPHYFDILKRLTITGYFTSEIGITQARNYLPIPGKFEACIPYNEGDRPWAI